MDIQNNLVRVQLPGWDDEAPFEVLLKRPSILSMAACGTIPNELLGAAQKLFCDGYDTAMPINQLGKLLLTIAREALVEPTLDEMENVGCTLTDMQLAAIYNYTQTGVRALLPFRTGDDASQPVGNEQTI